MRLARPTDTAAAQAVGRTVPASAIIGNGNGIREHVESNTVPAKRPATHAVTGNHSRLYYSTGYSRR